MKESSNYRKIGKYKNKEVWIWKPNVSAIRWGLPVIILKGPFFISRRAKLEERLEIMELLGD